MCCRHRRRHGNRAAGSLRRACRKRITIPYRLDMPRRYRRGCCAAQKRCAAPRGASPEAASREVRERHDRLPPRRARLPVRRAAGRRARRSRSRRGVHWLRMPLPFALDHINLWLLAEDDGFTLVDCGFGDAATRALWERHFATTLAGRPIRRIIATHCHPDHVGNAAWLSARFDAPVAMTHAEYLTAHALFGQHARLRARRRRSALSPPRHGEPSTSRRWTRAAITTGAACRSCRSRSTGCCDGDVRRRGRHVVARHRRPRPFARACVAPLARSATC